MRVSDHKLERVGTVSLPSSIKEIYALELAAPVSLLWCGWSAIRTPNVSFRSGLMNAATIALRSTGEIYGPVMVQ